MLRHFLSLLLLLGPLSTVAQAELHKTVDKLDGSDWQQFDDVARGAYIVGYVSAMFQAEVLATICEAAVAVDKLTADSTVAKICVEERREFRFAEVAGVAQYRDGLNAFYKDFRNAQVPLTKAIGLVRDEINGRSPEDVEKELTQWRQCHADSSKCANTATPAKPSPPAPEHN